jgi:hypothetical protein
MDSETYKKAAELNKSIDSIKYEIHRIERILESTELSCKIAGYPKSEYYRVGDYYSQNKELIRKILESDKANYILELEKLTKQLIEL